MGRSFKYGVIMAVNFKPLLPIIALNFALTFSAFAQENNLPEISEDALRRLDSIENGISTQKQKELNYKLDELDIVLKKLSSSSASLERQILTMDCSVNKQQALFLTSQISKIDEGLDSESNIVCVKFEFLSKPSEVCMTQETAKEVKRSLRNEREKLKLKCAGGN